MSAKKNVGSGPSTKRQCACGLSAADIELLTRHPQIKIANRRLRKALEAITGWKMTLKGGVPRNEFRLAAEYEDALGDVKEAFIVATRDWLLTRTCPLCNSRPKRTRLGTR
jgi:hypothetical protein